MARYVIVPERSQISLEAKSSLHPIRVETTGLEGYLEVATVDGHVDLKVAPKAHVELDAQQLKTGNSLYDRELERKLEMRKYSRVRGDLREAKPLGSGDRYHLRGELSLHGTTSPIEGDVTIRMVLLRAIESPTACPCNRPWPMATCSPCET